MNKILISVLLVTLSFSALAGGHGTGALKGSQTILGGSPPTTPTAPAPTGAGGGSTYYEKETIVIPAAAATPTNTNGDGTGGIVATTVYNHDTYRYY